jgi:DNA-binding HxlR family transcriptional regulator
VPTHHSPSQFSQRVISERRQFSPQAQAAIRFAIELVQGKWKIGILCRLQEGPARLGDLRRLFPAASKKMLTQHLRQMERDGLIVRSDLSGRVPHVQYSLLEPRGMAISRLLDFLSMWGAEYLPESAPNSSDVIGRWLGELKSAKCNSASDLFGTRRGELRRFFKDV